MITTLVEVFVKIMNLEHLAPLDVENIFTW